MGILINCPAYYSVSAPKAELLNKIKDMPEEVNEEEEQVDVNEKKVRNWGPCSALRRKIAEGPAGSLAPYGRGQGPAASPTSPSHQWALDLRGTWNNFLTACLSFSFLSTTKVRVSGDKLYPQSLRAGTRTEVPCLLAQRRDPSTVLRADPLMARVIVISCFMLRRKTRKSGNQGKRPMVTGHYTQGNVNLQIPLLPLQCPNE